MQTAADMITTCNALFLDIAPFVALAALALAWIRKARQYRAEEREIRDRIRHYRESAGREG